MDIKSETVINQTTVSLKSLGMSFDESTKIMLLNRSNPHFSQIDVRHKNKLV